MPRPLFLAAPSRGAGNLALVESLLRELQVATGGALKGSLVFVPHLQIGDVGVDVDAASFAERALAALREAVVVVAVLDGPQTDDAVAFLVGHASALGKPVLGYATDARARDPLVERACRSVTHDVRALAGELAKLLA